MNWRMMLVPIMALALVLGASSCEKNGGEDPKPSTVIKVAQESVMAEAIGGSLSVAYTVENPVEGAQISAASTMQWVTDLTVSAEEVSFTVLPNDEGTERESVVTLTCSESQSTATFRVSQKAGPLTPFTVEFLDITESEVHFNVTPTDPKMTYVVLTVTQEHAAALTDEELFVSLMEHYQIYADAEGMSVGQYLEYYDQIHEGAIENYYYDRLIPETDYFLAVVGMNADCEQLTEFVREPFSTTEVEMLDVTFAISATKSGSGATITVEPSDSDVRYYSEAVKKAAVDASEVGLAGAVEQLIQMYIMYGEMAGQTMDEVLDAMLLQGKKTYEKAMDAGVEYVIFAVAVNDNGYICSEFSEEVFSN